MWLKGRSKKDLIEKYTEELTNITSQIHQLDQKLKNSQQSSDRLQSQLNYYGLAISILAFAYVYWNYQNALSYSVGAALATLLAAFLAKSLTSKADQWQRNRQSRQLSKLKTLHQSTLNKLKEETNFHATNSIIQRFSQGESQTEDAMLLMDEQIGKKYQELQALQEELDQFRKTDKSDDKQEREKWFDKVLNVLAGGDIPRPIICTRCKKHSGAFKVGHGPLIYMCPQCGWLEPPPPSQPIDKNDAQQEISTIK